MKPHILIETNKLTDLEVELVYSLYPGFRQFDEKLILRQIEHISDDDIYMLCHWVDNTPFLRIKQNRWRIERGYDIIGVKADIHSFHINMMNGNVHVYLDGRLSTMGNQANAFQFYRKYYYAFPLYFEPTHWANFKSPFQLGIAIPDRSQLIEQLNILYNRDAALINDYFADILFYKIDLLQVDIFNEEINKIKKQIRVK